MVAQALIRGCRGVYPRVACSRGDDGGGVPSLHEQALACGVALVSGVDELRLIARVIGVGAAESLAGGARVSGGGSRWRCRG